MERLTKRDRKGRAYFDDDGSLIRGANGTFHQKKDMTNQFIHQRFVALDKAIDRLAAYEDTGLEPEEIMALIPPPNDPLTLEELWEMDGEPVWNDTMKKWYFVVLSWEHGPVAMDYKGAWRPLDDRYYRRKPEECHEAPP